MIEDWTKKALHGIALMAKERNYAVAREDLTDLIESLSRLPRDRKVRLLILSYRRLGKWIDRQLREAGVP